MHDTIQAQAGTVFRTSVMVRFGDCDPAGIVFYPRYFEMFNNLVEDWCAIGLGVSFGELINGRGFGLPTVSIQTDFVAASKLGDLLTAELSVLKLGTASIKVAIRLIGAEGGDRVRTTLVLVLMDLKKECAARIPESMRARITEFSVEE
ncbi:MAG: thioesterase family protein [Pseudomonadota bacterium]